MPDNSSQLSTPVVELGRQMKMERTRPRSGRPKGYAITEIPKHIGAKRTIERLEGGQQDRVDVGRVMQLCKFYKTEPQLAEHLEELAEATHAEKWWDAYSPGMEGWAWLYQQREEQASRIKNHDTVYVPLLVQHRAYMEAIVEALARTSLWSKIDLDVAKQLRVDRADRWMKSRRPLTCVIGEPALMLNLGDGVMDLQKQHLLELAKLPHVEIYVTPLSAGKHNLLGVECSVLEFDDGTEAVIYVGSPHTAKYIAPDSRVGTFYNEELDTARQMSVLIEEYLR
ncbi:MAG: Scr1 family TA system antitoxin-like transcriptional regulator [Stackebrandtia sp.]